MCSQLHWFFRCIDTTCNLQSLQIFFCIFPILKGRSHIYMCHLLSLYSTSSRWMLCAACQDIYFLGPSFRPQLVFNLLTVTLPSTSQWYASPSYSPLLFPHDQTNAICLYSSFTPKFASQFFNCWVISHSSTVHSTLHALFCLHKLLDIIRLNHHMEKVHIRCNTVQFLSKVGM